MNSLRTRMISSLSSTVSKLKVFKWTPNKWKPRKSWRKIRISAATWTIENFHSLQLRFYLNFSNRQEHVDNKLTLATQSSRQYMCLCVVAVHPPNIKLTLFALEFAFGSAAKEKKERKTASATELTIATDFATTSELSSVLCKILTLPNDGCARDSSHVAYLSPGNGLSWRRENHRKAKRRNETSKRATTTIAHLSALARFLVFFSFVLLCVPFDFLRLGFMVVVLVSSFADNSL